MVLYEGVDELALTSITDTYPRSFASTIRVVAPERTVIRSRHGLDLVPRWSFADAPALDRLLVPGDAVPAATVQAVAHWAEAHGQPRAEYLHRDAAGSFAYDAALRDMARRDSRDLAIAAARGLEYPIEQATLAGAAFPYDLLPRPAVLSLLGLLAALGVGRIRPARRPAVA
ncbi:MAG: hypothetical protein QJR03_08985 [Sphaerobacter sp.]|nr:hypothetical protein [Sphaerobacter sp.]